MSTNDSNSNNYLPINSMHYTNPAQRLYQTDSSTIVGTNLQNTSENLHSPTTKISRCISVLTGICLVLSIIVAVGSIMTIIGLISGLFTSNQGIAMASSLFLGAVYSFIRLYGTIFCIITLIVLIYAKKRYHLSIKKSLLIVVISLCVIHIPSIIISFLLTPKQ